MSELLKSKVGVERLATPWFHDGGRSHIQEQNDPEKSWPQNLPNPLFDLLAGYYASAVKQMELEIRPSSGCDARDSLPASIVEARTVKESTLASLAARDLLEVGIASSELLASGFTSKDLLIAGVPADALIAAGATLKVIYLI